MTNTNSTHQLVANAATQAHQCVYGSADTLRFKGAPIRILTVNCVPWFALPDLCDAIGLNDYAASRVNAPSFPAHAKMECDEEPDPTIPGEPQPVTILSPMGVWWWTHLTDPGRGQNLAAWTKREAIRAYPEVALCDPSVFLTLQPNGTLPPYPLKYSGRKSEWIELKDANPGAFAVERRQPAILSR